ncbi:AAA family ATPase [Moraxella bovis]|uniref:AAA family ATPase n=1 Tax=Moraxella bovis TaxID=476 RepID=UPI000DC7E3A3|nr:AAA family ATPase [Moraxella bovis]AWY21783.1 hypothetical protein DQF64_14500 [Moraxella bovis]
MVENNENPKKQLPIGIQTFSKLRQNDECYYVDKTPKIIEMVDGSGCGFYLAEGFSLLATC